MVNEEKLSAVLSEFARTLITDFPRYPLQLNLGFRPGSPATNESRYLTTPDQLGKVEVFLAELDALLKI